MRISLVVVGWHSAPWIERLLPTAAEADEIVVVDHSEDGAEAARLRELPLTRLVLQANRGYGAGLNRGAREAAGDVLVLANPDVRFAEGTIGRLAALATRPGVGAAGPAILWTPERPWQLPHSAHHTWVRELLAARLPALARRVYLRQMDRAWKAAVPAAVPVLGGAVIVTTRAVFEASGGFDERFFLFFEENDWCLRVRRAGGRLLVDPGAAVYHEWGHAIGDAAAAHHARSLDRYRRLHLPRAWVARHPTPPAVREPRLREGSGPGCEAGDELLLVTSARCDPAARLVARSSTEDVASLLPESIHPGRFMVVRRRGSFERLRTVEIPARD